MKLTVRSEYALLALVYLARYEREDFLSVQTIAAAQKIPPRFLEQILHQLRLAKLLCSSKGKGGGFRLAKPPGQISLAEIVRLFDGALAPTESVSTYFYKSTPIERESGLVELFREMRDYIANRMETTTLADVIENGAGMGTSSQAAL